MSVDYSIELKIIKLIRKILEDEIHGSIVGASLGAKKKSIDKAIPHIEKSKKYIIEHYNKMSHSLIKDDFRDLYTLFEEYKKKCLELSRATSIDVTDINDLSAKFSDVIDKMNVIEEHTHIDIKK